MSGTEITWESYTAFTDNNNVVLASRYTREKYSGRGISTCSRQKNSSHAKSEPDNGRYEEWEPGKSERTYIIPILSEGGIAGNFVMFFV